MHVSAFEAADVGALALSCARYEKAHVRRRRLRAGVKPEAK
jgi:hypothetical protein